MARNRRCSRQTLSLLEVLIEQPHAWQYGYDISRETGLQSGTLYPILMRLSDRGMLESKWEASPQSGRPPRHMYRLTAQGVDYAKDQVAAASGSRPDEAIGSEA